MFNRDTKRTVMIINLDYLVWLLVKETGRHPLFVPPSNPFLSFNESIGTTSSRLLLHWRACGLVGVSPRHLQTSTGTQSSPFHQERMELPLKGSSILGWLDLPLKNSWEQGRQVEGKVQGGQVSPLRLHFQAGPSVAQV